MKEISAPKEKIIPERIDKHDRAEEPESHISRRRSRQQKKAMQNREADHVIGAANHDPAPEGNRIPRQAKLREPMLDATSGKETFQGCPNCADDQ